MKKRFLILALAILLVLQSFLAISCNTERQSGTEATEKATERENEKATEKPKKEESVTGNSGQFSDGSLTKELYFDDKFLLYITHLMI